jgi:hypothetical protein
MANNHSTLGFWRSWHRSDNDFRVSPSRVGPSEIIESHFETSRSISRYIAKNLALNLVTIFRPSYSK